MGLVTVYMFSDRSNKLEIVQISSKQMGK